jgi:hypothetical protein
MKQTFRWFNAVDFESTTADKSIVFVHDVLSTPFSSAIGNSLASFFGACMILVVLFSTQATFAYMNVLFR